MCLLLAQLYRIAEQHDVRLCKQAVSISFNNYFALLLGLAGKKFQRRFLISSLPADNITHCVHDGRSSKLSVWGIQQPGEYSDDYVNDHDQTGCLYRVFPRVRKSWSIPHSSLSHNVQTCPAIFTWSGCFSQFCLFPFWIRSCVALAIKLRYFVFIILPDN